MIRKKGLYIVAVLSLLLVRVLVLHTNLAQYLYSRGYDEAARFVAMLARNAHFNEYMGGWALPIFVVCVILFWMTEDDNNKVPTQFLLLPIAYVPFCLVGTVLTNAHFNPRMLYIQPIVIIPFGYVYILAWAALIWLLGKIRIAR